MKDIITNNADRLRLGDVTCVVRDKRTGKERLTTGSVARIQYKKDVSEEIKKKYVKNMVYVIYSDNEDIVQYRQSAKQVTGKNEKINTFKKTPIKRTISARTTKGVKALKANKTTSKKSK